MCTSGGVPFQSQWNVRTVYISFFQLQALERKGLENLHEHPRCRALTGYGTQEQWLCVFGLRVLCVTLDGSPRILLCYVYVKGGDSGHGQGVKMQATLK